MTLHEIRTEYQDALNKIVVNEDGEIIGLEELEAVEGEFTEKAEAVAIYIKGLIADVNALENEKESIVDRLDGNIASKKREIERLSNYLWYNISSSGLSKFETALCKVTHRDSVSVEVDEFELPESYFRVTIPEPKKLPDKKLIKEALQKGEVVQGACLKKTTHVKVE